MGEPTRQDGVNMNQLPSVEFNGVAFTWDSRLREFRDSNCNSYPVDHSTAEAMDYAIEKQIPHIQKMALLDALDQNNARGVLS